MRELFDTIGAHGRREDGGCERLAFSPQERAARAELVERARDTGFQAGRDRLGSVFVVRPAIGAPAGGPGVRRGGEAAAASAVAENGAVYTGSHLDTVPAGGCFDGASGVLCGLAALELIEKAGIETRLPIVLVSWANEEGARFQPAMMGSGVFTGALDFEEAAAARDSDGVAVAEELERETAAPTGIFDLPRPAVYVELHPEQGRVLENAGMRLGAVEGVQGQIAGDWAMRGRADHAGATPMSDRADALVAAAELVSAVREAAAAEPPGVATVGSLAVEPGARNAVPGSVRGTLDVRHPEDEAVSRIVGEVLEAGRRIGERAGCRFEWREAWRAPAVRFSAEVISAIETASARRGVEAMRLPSGAGHDAVRLSEMCPSGMIFVPSRGGVSHSPDELTSYEDLAAGATVLADVLVTLAGPV
jgi:N-carbamoyl-L-amino-acid hydrolase